MPVLTKANIQKIKLTYLHYLQERDANEDFENFFDNISRMHDGFPSIDYDDPDDPVMVDVLALAASVLEKRPELQYTMDMYCCRYGISPNIVNNILNYRNDLDNIEELDDNTVSFNDLKHKEEYDKVNNPKVYNPKAYNIMKESETGYYNANELNNVNNLVGVSKTNAIFDRYFLSMIIHGQGNGNTIDDMIKKDISGDEVTKSVNKELNEIKEVNDDLFSYRDDSTNARILMQDYVALRDRSEKRTWGDVFKHPWNTFTEWLAKKNVTNELKKITCANDKQLDALYKICHDDKVVPDDYDGLNEDGSTNFVKDLDDEMPGLGDDKVRVVDVMEDFGMAFDDRSVKRSEAQINNPEEVINLNGPGQNK